MTKINFYKIVILLAIFGIGLAIYLLYESFGPTHQSLCYVNSAINCEASTKGSLSRLFGIPVPLYGLTGFVFMILGAIKKWPKLVFGMAVFGTFFCLRINLIEIFQLRAFCPVCFACQLDMIAVFILGLLLLRERKTPEVF